jgi:hypothetical protein
MPSTECRSCHAEIIYAEKFPMELNDKGLPKSMPINYDSVNDPKGNLEVWAAEVIAANTGAAATVYHFRYLHQGEEPTRGKRGISHYATCPDAGKWRKK